MDAHADLENKARQKAEREVKKAVTQAARKQSLSTETAAALMVKSFGLRS
ncbi:hypothetical protein [Saccharibacter floricola]|nr:hypothetical protein [Saccharibacter floricola]